jgi:CheY-like chemotaxis protein
MAITAPTILLVEDSNDVRRTMKTVLRMRGYRVIEAAHGREAVESAPQERPDLILMDLNMPVLDGWEATRQLRLLAETRDTPIIGLAAHCREGWREEALNAGCNDCVQKPVDVKALDKILSQFLKQKTLH